MCVKISSFLIDVPVERKLLCKLTVVWTFERVTLHLHLLIVVIYLLSCLNNIFLLFFPSFPSRPVCWRRIFQCKDSYVLMALYLHQFHSSESHWASGGEALNMETASCRYFPRFKCSLSVHCFQTAPLHWPQFHSQGPVCRTVYMIVPLCSNECHRMLEKWNHNQSRTGLLVGVQIDYFSPQSEPN